MRRYGLIGAMAVVAVVLLSSAVPARAFSGVVNYTGDLGPVSSQRPLCLCVFRDAGLEDGIGCLLLRNNNFPYSLDDQLGSIDYYVVAFLDIHINERLDADEPYEIFENRGAVPGDPIAGTSSRNDVDFVFGDENLAPPTPTAIATASATTTPSPSATATRPTATPLPTCATPGPSGDVGDCNGDGQVAINELIIMVNIALGRSSLSACPAADPNGDGIVVVAEIIAAVRRSLTGC